MLNTIQEQQGSALQEAGIKAQGAVLIVGGGPAGIRVAAELSKRGVSSTVFNAERWKPYNRVKLSSLLAGEAQIGQVYTEMGKSGEGQVTRYDNVSIIEIDRETQQVLASNGRVFDYDKLVLALGSRAFVPKITGSDLSDVYTFRNFDHVEALVARSNSSRNTVVIGGGLLGLEAARGMHSRGGKVVVVEHESRLMPRQLDQAGGELLARKISDLGIDILTGERVAKIVGDTRVEGVALASGKTLPADTVIICTGVRANTQLAIGADLSINRAIVIDDGMRTKDPNIFAVGECAEHNGVVHGLVGPSYEQAVVAAQIIAGENVAYQGSVPATKLKVVGADVFSVGDFESCEQAPGIKSHVYEDKAAGIYRRLLLERSRIVAALGVGEWPEASELQRATANRQSLNFLQVRRFLRTGIIWGDNQEGVTAWPRESIVCNCTGVTKGGIEDACLQGAKSLEDIRTMTGANTVCGTCQPLVNTLVEGDGAKTQAAKWWKALLGVSAAAVLATLFTVFLPRIGVAENFSKEDFFRSMWFDSIWKQWSGYTLLSITALAAALGIRRRLKLFERLGSWDGWRLVHLIIGGAAAIVLVWHTGFRLGNNLNFWLMLSFLATLVFGAITGLITGGEHELRNRNVVASTSKPRSLPFWLHVIALWPLPVLLIIHILSVYAY